MSVDKFKYICIDGNVKDDNYVKRVDDEISALIEQGSRYFVFVLDNIKFLDSETAGIIIDTVCYTQKEGGSMFIIVKDNSTRIVLETAGVHHFIKIFDSKDEFLKTQGVTG
ncbi:MAG: STAS domain-containing protein [Chitinispirillia bacterium]|nr:STAS domain-containing protein [Chitinispirillia bacterium]